MCKHAVKKLLFIIRYVPDQYKTQQMCDKSILENGGTLEAVPYWNKAQKTFDKTINNYAHALKFSKKCQKDLKNV